MSMSTVQSFIRPVARFCPRAQVRRSSSASPSSVLSLQAAFRDPSSPFYLAPGTVGPAAPEDHPAYEPPYKGSSREYRTTTGAPSHATQPVELAPAEEAKEHLIREGYNFDSFWEQKIAWGDHDAFQHVNNAHYLRYIESSRIVWMTSLGRELGGPSKARDMLKGKGISLILKSVTLNYKRPVTYPDTLLVAHRLVLLPNEPPTQFTLEAIAYSYAQKAVVLTGSSVLVWYDYDKLKKADPGETVRAALRRRAEKAG